jgi:hypothetical protein
MPPLLLMLLLIGARGSEFGISCFSWVEDLSAETDLNLSAYGVSVGFGCDKEEVIGFSSEAGFLFKPIIGLLVLAFLLFLTSNAITLENGLIGVVVVAGDGAFFSLLVKVFV